MLLPQLFAEYVSAVGRPAAEEQIVDAQVPCQFDVHVEQVRGRACDGDRCARSASTVGNAPRFHDNRAGVQCAQYQANLAAIGTARRDELTCRSISVELTGQQRFDSIRPELQHAPICNDWRGRDWDAVVVP